MSGNTFGHLFCVTTFGESHGAAIGCVVDGCPPGMELSAADMQHDLVAVLIGSMVSSLLMAGLGMAGALLFERIAARRHLFRA